MIKMVGKILMEAACQFCNSIYLMDESDAELVIDEDDEIEKIIFQCDNCEGYRMITDDFKIRKVSDYELKKYGFLKKRRP